MSNSPQTRQSLLAAAHTLHPVVIIGQKGLTESVVTEVDRALFDHQLIKIRVNAGSKDERKQMIELLTHRLQATCLTLIGHIAILYRPTHTDA